MIRLTLLNGKHWYVNPDHIVGIKSGHKYGAAIESDHQTGIEHTIDVTQVQESPEEVARKVLEWRLVMERYRAYVNAATLDEKPQSNECWELAANARAELVRLAGLEEPNHDNVREKDPQDTFSRAMLRELEKIEEYKRAKEDDWHE